MQIKKFRANNLKDAMTEMKQLLGTDAIVLSTNVIEADPELGTKKMFEITGGIDEEVMSGKKDSEEENEILNFENEIEKLKSKIYRKKQEVFGTKKTKSQPKQKSALKSTSKATIKKYTDEIVDVLTHRDVDERVISTIVRQLNKYSALLNNKNLDSYATSILASMIPTENFEIIKQKRPKVVSLVGPTGVGKTTCIAKLSVISKILHNLNVGLISIDTYRLGALDQLKIFADISDIELNVAYEPADIPKFISKMKKKDLIFMDTVGRSQNKTEQLNSINQFLNATQVDETYLVLSATSMSKNMIDVAQKFRVIKYNGIVITKLDEAVSFGNILNMSQSINVPIKYLTNGQIIPDDIIAGDSEFIANMIYSGKVTQ